MSASSAGQSPDTPEPREVIGSAIVWTCSHCGEVWDPRANSCAATQDCTGGPNGHGVQVVWAAAPGEDTAAPTVDAVVAAAREVVEFWREGNWSLAVGADEAVGRLDDALAARTPLAAPVDTTPDLGDREELVDILDTYMRLDDRADAERVADALIGHPDLLARLAARTPQPSEGWRFEHVFALREAATQCRWNIDHVEGVPEPSLEFQRHWRGTAVWLEKRAAAIERGEKPDAGYRPGEPT